MNVWEFDALDRFIDRLAFNTALDLTTIHEYESPRNGQRTFLTTILMVMTTLIMLDLVYGSDQKGNTGRCHPSLTMSSSQFLDPAHNDSSRVLTSRLCVLYIHDIITWKHANQSISRLSE